MMERWQPVGVQRRSWITWRSARRDAACGIRWKNNIVRQMEISRDYGFHGVIQHVNASILGEMKEIAENDGITSFKVYTTYDDMLTDEEIFQVLKEAKKDGIVIAVHCENDGVINYLRKTYRESGCTEPKYHPLSRPARCEAEAVDRLLHLAAMAGDAPLYIVHLSSKEGLMEVMKRGHPRKKNFAVETCTQYLTLTDEMYEDPKEG